MQYAGEIGIDRKEFANCVSSGKKELVVNADLLEAYAADIQGTPTYIINGKILEGSQPLEILQEMIESALGE